MYYSNQFALQLAHLSRQNKRSRCRIHLMKNINLQQEKSGGERDETPNSEKSDSVSSA